MGPVFLLQLSDHFKSLRFLISLGLLLLFFVANGVVYTWKTDRLSREQAVIAADNERLYEEVETLDQAVDVEYRVSTRSLGTEFITEGGFNWFMDAYRIPVAVGAGAPSPTNVLTTNHWVQRFDVVDWTLVVRAVLSFLCIVLAYDTISAEMESGTLRQVLANPLSRGRYLVARFAAHLSVLLALVLLGSLISLLLLSANGVLTLDAALVQAYGLFLLMVVLYLSLFLGVAIGVSALARQSARALVLLLLVWAGFIVIIPQASYPIAVSAVEAPDDYLRRKDEVIEDARTALAAAGIGLRGREEGRPDGYAMERRYAQRLAEAQQESERIVRAADRQMLRRYHVARTVNLLSPGLRLPVLRGSLPENGDRAPTAFLRPGVALSGPPARFLAGTRRGRRHLAAHLFPARIHV